MKSSLFSKIIFATLAFTLTTGAFAASNSHKRNFAISTPPLLSCSNPETESFTGPGIESRQGRGNCQAIFSTAAMVLVLRLQRRQNESCILCVWPEHKWRSLTMQVDLRQSLRMAVAIMLVA